MCVCLCPCPRVWVSPELVVSPRQVSPFIDPGAALSGEDALTGIVPLQAALWRGLQKQQPLATFEGQEVAASAGWAEGIRLGNGSPLRNLPRVLAKPQGSLMASAGGGARLPRPGELTICWGKAAKARAPASRAGDRVTASSLAPRHDGNLTPDSPRRLFFGCFF